MPMVTCGSMMSAIAIGVICGVPGPTVQVIDLVLGSSKLWPEKMSGASTMREKTEPFTRLSMNTSSRVSPSLPALCVDRSSRTLCSTAVVTGVIRAGSGSIGFSVQIPE